MLINANYVGWYALCVTEGRHWSHYMEEYYWVGKLSINCILTQGEQKSWALCLGALHLECLAKKKTFHSKPCVLFECNLFAIDLLLCSSISYFLFLCVCLHVCILFVVTPSERYITLSFFKYLIYAVFIRLVLHCVWQPFCCPFILTLAAWVLAYCTAMCQQA